MLIARLFYMSAMGFPPSKSQGMGDASKLQARGDARLKAEKLYWPAFGAKQLDKPRFEIADPKRHSVFDTVGTACFEYALPPDRNPQRSTEEIFGCGSSSFPPPVR